MRGGYPIRGEGIYFVTFTVVAWVDIFMRKIYRDILIESLKFCQKEKGLEVYAFAIMSNHVHLIISSAKGNVSGIIRDFKKYTSYKILEAITKELESRRKWMLNIFKFEASKNKRVTNHQFWTHDNHPILLDTNSMMDQKLEYIHNNPVKAGIVYSAEDYVYSSASAYMGRESLLDLIFIE